jgi:hypothetical protein
VKNAMFVRGAAVLMSAAAFSLGLAAQAATHHPYAGTMLCRPVEAGEHATAMADNNTKLTCKQIDGAGMMDGHGCPKLKPGMTAEQIDAAWREVIYSALSVRSGDG